MKKRTYSVFVDEGVGDAHKHTRITPLALVLKDARRIFQGILLHGSMSGRRMNLRPAAEDYEREAEYRDNKDRIFPELKKGGE